MGVTRIAFSVKVPTGITQMHQPDMLERLRNLFDTTNVTSIDVAIFNAVGGNRPITVEVTLSALHGELGGRNIPALEEAIMSVLTPYFSECIDAQMPTTILPFTRVHSELVRGDELEYHWMSGLNEHDGVAVVNPEYDMDFTIRRADAGYFWLEIYSPGMDTDVLKVRVHLDWGVTEDREDFVVITDPGEGYFQLVLPAKNWFACWEGEGT